jgi:hypothetical protein
MDHRKAQLALAKRNLSETAQLIQLQEQLVASMRARGSDAEVPDHLLSTFKTVAYIWASHTEVLDREIENGTNLDS